MCGISGIVSKNYPVKASILKAMTDVISHRGPDDFGFYYGDNFAFGHRRLAIVDLSQAGHQPMEYLNRYVITYNGEIYNHIELRSELQSIGYNFLSHTDTEVIMAAYDAWGSECVNKFNGMWAFALYDNTEKVIFCSRDRFGVKPFYYTHTSSVFAFGSEIKQLIIFYPERKVNKRLLIDYIFSGLSDHTEETFFEDIYSLRGGHNIIFDLKTYCYRIVQWYTIDYDPSCKKNSDEQVIECYKTEFLRSVQYRLRSDVRVGTCLSGGVDSSSVAAIAADKYNDLSSQCFIAIHAQSLESETDESNFAIMVAQAKDIDLSIITPSIKDFLQAIDDVFYTQEEPFSSPSIFMQYFVMKKARELGCVVMLDGQGGDETLLGYERYYPAYLLSLSFWQAVKEFFQSYKNSKLSPTELIAYCFYFTIYPLRCWKLKKKLYFLKPECFRQKDWLKKIAQNYLSIAALQKIEILHTQLPHLLRYEDKNSMRHSVETRLPFVDYRLVEMALSIDSRHKIKDGWTKHILRKIMDDILPKAVVWRKKKMGFNAPDKTWINFIRPQMYNDIKESAILFSVCRRKINLSKMDDKTLWKLYSIAKWEKIYDVKPNRIKILHLTSVHARYDTRVFLKMCISLAKHGYNTSLVVADGKGDEVKNQVNIYDIGADTCGRLSRMTRTVQKIFDKAKALDADIYHLHDPELIPIGLKLKRMGKIVIFDSHEDIPKDILSKPYINILTRNLVSKIFSLYENYSYRKLDGVITATPFIRDNFFNINSNAVDINNYPMLGELQSEILWRNKKRQVCYVGGIGKIRGINEMVQAIEQTSNIRLQLCGQFSEFNVKQQVTTYKGWQFVDELGFLDRTQVKQVLENSMAALVIFLPLPNHIHAQPNKMFEYMGAGIPVIASNFPLWKKIIEDNQCGLCVDPLQPKSIAKAIQYIVDHPKQAEKMGKNGLKAVHEKYNWGIEEQKLLYFYSQLSRLDICNNI